MADGNAPIIISQAGIYDLPMEFYHSQCCDGPSVSSGGLRTMENASPAHFWCDAYGLNPDAQRPSRSDAFDFGKAVHALLFDDQDEIAKLVTSPFDDFRKKEAREWRDEQWSEGRIIITDAVMDSIRGIHAALAREPGVAALLTAGEPEKSMIWRDAETGVWLKSRPDRFPSDRVFADLKTAKSSDPRLLNTEIVSRGYHMQLGLAAMGLKALTGEDATDCWLVFVEKTAPHAVTTVRLGDELVDYGMRQCRRSIRKFADCLRDGDWPTYCEGPVTLHGPDWFTKRCEKQIEELAL